MKKCSTFRPTTVRRWLPAVLLAAVFVAWAAAGGGARVAFAQPASPAPTAGATSTAAPPTLSLRAIPSYGRAPLTVGFFVVTLGTEKVEFSSYRWNFGDGHVSTLAPPFATNTYTKPGTYTVTVTATMKDGRSVTGFVGVIVRPPKTF